MNAESKDFVMEEILVYEIKTEFEHEAVNDLINSISRGGGGKNRPPYVFFFFSQKLVKLTLLENL